jgi:C4-dicarboxylate-specific signal transduction histidine kinase
MKPVFVRSLAFPALVAAALVVLAVALALLSLSRNLGQFEPLRAHTAAMQRVQTQSLAMQYALTRTLAPSNPADQAVFARLRDEVDALVADPALLSNTGRARLQRARALLDTPDDDPRARLLAATTLLHEALADESRAHDALLAKLAAQARFEFQLLAAAFLLILLAGAAAWLGVRRRVLEPLRDLDTWMGRLARHDFSRIEASRADSLIAPLFARYNDMVARLAEIETAQVAREASLEAEVRAATRELIAHNRSLAQADKLAAVGELAASLAHELRNPLAGITLALANLRHELPEGEARERLDAVAAELGRLTRLMNRLLDGARHAPEAPQRVRLAQAVDEVAALARYQIAPDIHIEQAIAPDCLCLLPPDRLRQCVLNLLLNAAQALPERGHIRVLGQRDGSALELAVEDDGPGFPADLLQAGVAPFSSQRAGGTGLGLASVRRFAHDLGGSLSLANCTPHGARVTLHLPCPTME